MRVRLGGRERGGQAIDLSDVSGAAVDAMVSVDDATGESVDPEAVVAAVRAETGAVDCPTPGPVHDHVGLVVPGRTIQRRAALAAVARSRGKTPPQQDELDRVHGELSRVDSPSVDLDGPRQRAAAAGSEAERLRERVAAMRGRVRALRDERLDASEAEAELADAAAALAETETERAAAEQALERARQRARAARDTRDRRLRLEDRAANLERAAREWLAEEVRPAVDRGVREAPDSSAESLADAEPVTGALAVARVAELTAPIVLACSRFESASDAADWLGASVIRCSGQTRP